MANTNTVFGLRLLSNGYGAPINAQTHPYTVASGDGTAMYVGDLVKLTGECDLGEDGYYHPTITQAAATDEAVGVVVGFLPNPNYLNQIHRTASTLRTALVCDDPLAYFEIQSTGTAATGDIGLCADVSVAAGSAITGVSGMQLDHAAMDGTARQLKIVALSQAAGAEFGAYTKFIVYINKHSHRATTGV